MSATGRGCKRIERDAYMTPPLFARVVLEKAFSVGYLSSDDLVFDPCAGEGAILKEAAAMGCEIEAAEIREECRPSLEAVTGGEPFIGDALAHASRICEFGGDMALVTNPPFNLAEKFVRTYAPHFRVSIWLLRLGWFEPDGRLPLFKEMPPSDLWISTKRPCFAWPCKTKKCGAMYPVGYDGPCEECGGKVGSGTDASAYVWAVWRKSNREKSPRVSWLEYP